MSPPAQAYVDKENRFSLVVPAGWKLVEPNKVTVDATIRTDWRLAATLVAESGPPAPTVAINALHRPWRMPREASGIADIERWIKSTWGEQVALALNTEMARVDGLPSFHSSILATHLGIRTTIDQYLIPVVNESYAIVAAIDGDHRKIAAQASHAIAQGFRVFKGWE